MGLFDGKKSELPAQAPLFQDKYMGSTTSVYNSHIEWGMMGKHESIPLSQVANVELPPLILQAVVETTGGKKVKIPLKNREGFKSAVMGALNAQGSGNHSASAPSAADELLKFAQLRDSGIITEAEFEAKKKELLG